MRLRKTQNFLKFGAELGENFRQILILGRKILDFFHQPLFSVISSNLQIVLLGLLVSGLWDGSNLNKAIDAYQAQDKFRKLVDGIIDVSPDTEKLYDNCRRQVPEVLKTIL